MNGVVSLWLFSFVSLIIVSTLYWGFLVTLEQISSAKIEKGCFVEEECCCTVRKLIGILLSWDNCFGRKASGLSLLIQQDCITCRSCYCWIQVTSKYNISHKVEGRGVIKVDYDGTLLEALHSVTPYSSLSLVGQENIGDHLEWLHTS